jgi:glyoxylase-like metal-dependent hydrolase (beta-lactamase superfamily II)
MAYPGRTNQPPEIRTCTLGPFATNCYVVAPPKQGIDRPCWIIDASFEPSAMLRAIRDNHWHPEALILTHTHVDHIAGVDEVLKAYPGLKVLVHESERAWLADPMLNLSGVMGLPVSVNCPVQTIGNGDTLQLGDMTWRVLHTPGHSPGGITLVDNESCTAIVGDTLFAGSIGRTDFPGSSIDVLAKAIRERLYTLPDDTRVLSGHGPETTIGREKRSNPYVRA